MPIGHLFSIQFFFIMKTAGMEITKLGMQDFPDQYQERRKKVVFVDDILA